MRKNEIFDYYETYCTYLESLYKYLKTQFNDKYVDELCTMRGYVGEEQRKLITDMKLGYCHIDDASVLGDLAQELGLLTSTGEFLLNDRFIIPVYDLNGRLVSLIGYYTDYRKYITLPTPFFSKECIFFNFNHAYNQSWNWTDKDETNRDIPSKYRGTVFLVEGIFDCLSLRALGLPAIATMGATVSKTKGELLKFFKKVVAIPDDDVTGKKSLNRYTKRGWQVPSNTVMIDFRGGEVDFGETKLHCKDIDNLVSWFEADEVRDMLLEYSESREDIEVLKL